MIYYTNNNLINEKANSNKCDNHTFYQLLKYNAKNEALTWFENTKIGMYISMCS